MLACYRLKLDCDHGENIPAEHQCASVVMAMLIERTWPQLCSPVWQIWASAVMCLWARITLPVLPSVCVCVCVCVRVRWAVCSVKVCFLSVCLSFSLVHSSCLFLSNILLLFASIYATDSSSSTPAVHLVSHFLSLTLSLCLLVSVLIVFFCFSSFYEQNHDTCTLLYVRVSATHTHAVFFTLL